MASLTHPLGQIPTPEAPPGHARRSFALATAANVLGWTAHTTYMYYLAPIALREAGIADRDALVFATTAVAMGLAVVPAGRLADRVPRRRVLRAGLALLGLAYVALLAPLTLGGVFAGTVATGVGLAFTFVSFQSYVADLLHGTARTAAYGRAGALGVLASAAGPFVAALVFRALPDEALGIRVNAALFALGALAGIALTFALPSVRVDAPEPRERVGWRETARAAGPVALVYLFMGAGYGMTAPYFTVYFLDHVGFANASWGYLLAAGTVASAAGSFLAGELGRRVSRQALAVAGQAGLLLASALFLFPLGTAFFAVGFLGRSLFATTTAPVMATLLMQRAHAARRAEAQGYVSLAWNAGWTVGAASGGVLLARMGGALFPLGGALALVGVAAGLSLVRRR